MSDREHLLEDALRLACDIAEQHGADSRELVTLRECASGSHPVSATPHDAPRRVEGEPYNMAGYGPGPTGARRAVPEYMTKQHDADCMHYVTDILEDLGPLTRGELLACARQDAAGDEPAHKFSNTTVAAALDRAVGLGLVLEEEHEDARARQGGCPPMYRVVAS